MVLSTPLQCRVGLATQTDLAVVVVVIQFNCLAITIADGNFFHCTKSYHFLNKHQAFFEPQIA